MSSLLSGRIRGFTLIEVLIAVAIVSIALLAALQASGATTANTADMRARMIAGWVAQDRLALHRARRDWLETGSQRGAEQQGGFEFGWREEVTPTPHGAFRRVDVFVYAAPDEGRILARVSGFITDPVRTKR